jgi:nicotinate-nucleotide adenylyltransferase
MRDGSPCRLGVLGGTFDPLHVGHLAVARDAAAAFDLDRVLFVPTGQPWQKSRYSSAEDRFLMASLGAAADRKFATSRIEIDRRGPTYTLDTMADLRGFHGDATELFFIAGADAVLKLGTWNGIDELGALCDIIAITRTGAELAGSKTRDGWPRIHIHEMEPVDVSATEIRKRVRSGGSIETFVPVTVARYIAERGLYAEEPESVDA